MFELLSLCSCILLILLIILCGFFLYRNIIAPIQMIIYGSNKTVNDATIDITAGIASNVPNAIQETKNTLSQIFGITKDPPILPPNQKRFKKCEAWLNIDKNGPRICQEDYGNYAEYIRKDQGTCDFGWGMGICSCPYGWDNIYQRCYDPNAPIKPINNNITGPINLSSYDVMYNY